MNKLLEKYWEGNTSLEEEQQLKRYFTSGNVASEHLAYKALFDTLALSNEVPQQSLNAFARVNKSSSWLHALGNHKYKSMAVAAGLGILVATGALVQDRFFTPIQEDLGTYETPEEAYEATVQALQLMGTQLNNGKEKLKPLNKIEEKTNEVFNAAVLDSINNASNK